MSLKVMCCVAALAAAACTHASTRTPAVAQIDGEQHVIVRAEAGRIWWAHRAWTEPHELWTLPSQGDVQNLAVTPSVNGFVVTFEQGGEQWRGSFGQRALDANNTELARREP